MNYHTSNDSGHALPIDLERVTDLLARYPRLSADEAREILIFLRTGRHLDIGLLTSNDRLRPNLDAFMEDHKAHFRVKWIEGAAVAGGIVAVLIILWLIVEAFA